MDDWDSKRFGDLYDEPSRNGLTKPKKVRGSGIKFVNMGELFRYDRLKNPECDLAPLTQKEKTLSLLKPNDLLFARQSLVLEGAGQCSIFISDSEDVAFESHIIRVRLKKESCIPLFYYYLFRSQEGRYLIESIVEQGAGASGIRGSDLANLVVPVPPVDDQYEIAALLGALDDKIELNRQTNETLEALARALFKDWFVDFGPTRTKAEGGAPYLAPKLWALFPDTLDDEDKPVGWEQRCVQDILDLAYGKALKSSDRVPGAVPVYGSSGITGYHNQALVEGPSIIVGRKGTVGSLYWEDKPFFPIDTTFYVKPKAPLTFCFYALQTLGLNKLNTDAAVPGLNRNNAYRLPVICPQRLILSAFNELITLFREKMRHKSEESQTLAQTRDLLLPKLMSDEIRLRDAERAVEAVL